MLLTQHNNLYITDQSNNNDVQAPLQSGSGGGIGSGIGGSGSGSGAGQ